MEQENQIKELANANHEPNKEIVQKKTITINQLRDLKNYSIAQLINASPSDLEGAFIEQLESLINPSQPIEVILPNQISIKTIIIQFFYKPSNGEKMYIKIIKKENKHEMVNIKQIDLWLYEYTSEKDSIMTIEYRFFSSKDTVKEGFKNEIITKNRMLDINSLKDKICFEKNSQGIKQNNTMISISYNNDIVEYYEKEERIIVKCTSVIFSNDNDKMN